MQIKLLGITDVYFDVIGHPDQIFYIHQILEKKWGYNGTVHQLLGRSQRPRGLRRRSAAAWLLGSRVRIPFRAWMFVSCVYMLSCVGRGLCGGLITRPEESYRVSICV
jgi:hypothetical protein